MKARRDTPENCEQCCGSERPPIPLIARIELLRHQFTMPLHGYVRCDKERHFPEGFAADGMSLDGEQTPLYLPGNHRILPTCLSMTSVLVRRCVVNCGGRWLARPQTQASRM